MSCVLSSNDVVIDILLCDREFSTTFADRKTCNWIEKRLKGKRVKNLAGETPPQVTKEIIKRSKLIITNDSGISFQGLLKNIHASWAEVLSIRLNAESAQDVVEVKTKNGDFSFPLFMKIESEEYPKLISGMSGWKWAYSDGTEQDVTKENCPLFLEMQKYKSKP